MNFALRDFLFRALFGLAIFAFIFAAIASRPVKRLLDFDQSFYISIAYDLDRYGVFSNGVFDDTDASINQPASGMFFVPVYPALIWLVMQADERFDRAVECAVEANEQKRSAQACDIYARPIHILHAMLLAFAALAIGRVAELLFGMPRLFFAAGALASTAFMVEAGLFSYIMTESLTIALYSGMALLLVIAWMRQRYWAFSAAGLMLALLCLTRPSFVILVPVIAVLVLVSARFLSRAPWRRGLLQAGLFVMAFALTMAPWIARNALVVGKAALTEEYGAAVLIERFAFNDMTAREFGWAFPYCVPVIGPPLVTALAGADATARFEWDSPGGFFERGRAQRNALVAQHGKLDPVIGGIVRDEMRERGINHVVTSIPLGWCGLWVAGLWSLLLLPVFAIALFAAFRTQALFVAHGLPALFMVAVHAGAANHYPRYNLILIGPIAAGAAWLLARVFDRWRARPA